MDIVPFLKAEIATFVDALSKLKDTGRAISCPFCGRVSSRLYNMQRHAASHLDGKLGAFVYSLETDERLEHPVFAEVVCIAQTCVCVFM